MRAHDWWRFEQEGYVLDRGSAREQHLHDGGVTEVASLHEDRDVFAVHDIGVVARAQPLAHALRIIGLDTFDERAGLLGGGLLRLAHRRLDEEPCAVLVPSCASEVQRCHLMALRFVLKINVCAGLNQMPDDVGEAVNGGNMQCCRIL